MRAAAAAVSSAARGPVAGCARQGRAALGDVLAACAVARCARVEQAHGAASRSGPPPALRASAWCRLPLWVAARAMSTRGSADDVRASLSAVADPDLQSDVVSLGFVRNVAVAPAGGGSKAAVSVDLVLSTPAWPTKEALQQACRDAVMALPWVESVEVRLSAERRRVARENPKTQAASSSGLKDVQRIIAVSSAKGGVGKSTVSVNLAYAIARLGGKVGIFDADLQGPSLPTMVALDNPRVTKSPRSETLMQPLQHADVKLMSYGFSAKAQKGQAAVMRGPMVASTVTNLLKSTDWGDLDYVCVCPCAPACAALLHATLCAAGLGSCDVRGLLRS